MGTYMGGSAPAMASQIADGYILVGSHTLKGYAKIELQTLRAELEKLQREARAEVPPQDDAMALQARNRKIGRLSSALTVLGHEMTVKK
jgi:hypothetical protein